MRKGCFPAEVLSWTISLNEIKVIIGLWVNNLPSYDSNVKLFNFIRTNCQRFNYRLSSTYKLLRLLIIIIDIMIGIRQRRSFI